MRTCRRADTSSLCKEAVKGTTPAPCTRTVILRRSVTEANTGCTGCRLEAGTSDAAPCTLVLVPATFRVKLNPAETSKPVQAILTLRDASQHMSQPSDVLTESDDVPVCTANASEV